MDFHTLLPQIFGYILIGGGLFYLVQLARGIRKCREIQTWPETSGEIIDSSTSGGWSRTGSSYMWIVRPKVAYRYRVGGQEYTGHTLAPTELNTQSPSDAEDKIRPYPVGKRVAVYYDRQNPQDAVLQREYSRTAFGVGALMVVCLLAGGILVLVLR